MPFDYYENLTKAQRATYRRSDAVAALPVPDPAALRPSMEAMRAALEADDRAATAAATATFARLLLGQWRAAPVALEVLARRPSRDASELHGLYTREADGAARLQVWMRTAANERPVAFRTFLRTVVHELLHHADFELLGLEDTFHTEGFFRRESALVRQLAGDPERRRKAPAAAPARTGGAQLALFEPAPAAKRRRG